MKQYLIDFWYIVLFCAPFTLITGVLANLIWGDPLLADMGSFYLINLVLTTLFVFINRNSEVNK